MPPRPRPSETPSLSIGALARAAGVPVETIRTWERRYGVPRAARRPSGHRLYPLSAVGHLRRIVRAIERGHRAGDVLSLTSDRLDALLDQTPPVPVPGNRSLATGRRRRRGSATSTADLMSLVAAGDGQALQSALEREALSRTAPAFLNDVVMPLLTKIGAAWKSRDIGIRHEHLASARVAEVLGTLRRRLERPVSRPVAVLAMLPGDAHELPLVMCSVLCVADGWRVHYAGPETPVAELGMLARDMPVDALILSVSGTVPPEATEEAIARLRQAIPAEVPIVTGGPGSLEHKGVLRLRDLSALVRWLAKTRRALEIPG